MPLKKYIRDIQDFPKPGIGFKDITPLLINPQARKETLEVLLSTLKDKKIDKVIGVELFLAWQTAYFAISSINKIHPLLKPLAAMKTVNGINSFI